MIGLSVGKYRIVEEIGRGAMGLVFKAQDEYLGRMVALKILAEKLADDPDMLRRFEVEGASASALSHPNICTVFECGNWKGRPYFAMELLTGQPLDTLMKAGPLAEPQLIEIGIGVARGLEAAHAIGVVHRDIKPANLFLTDAGQVKILDFGLAKQKLASVKLGDDAATMAMVGTRPGMLVGTLAYMSPEQIRCEPLDGRTDLYALGVTLFELATKKLPLGGGELPGAFGRVAGKLMARELTARYQSATEAREALQACRGMAARAG